MGGRVKHARKSVKPHLHPFSHTRQILNLGEAVVFIKMIVSSSVVLCSSASDSDIYFTNPFPSSHYGDGFFIYIFLTFHIHTRVCVLKILKPNNIKLQLVKDVANLKACILYIHILPSHFAIPIGMAA